MYNEKHPRYKKNNKKKYKKGKVIREIEGFQKGKGPKQIKENNNRSKIYKKMNKTRKIPKGRTENADS